MSRRTSADTRILILEAARAALEEGGYYDYGLEEIARRAGVSRQAVYLKFGSKAGLFGELMTYIEDEEHLGELLAPVREAETGAEALDRLVDAHAEFEPRIAQLATAFEHAASADATFRALYEQRMQWRYEGMRDVVRRLRADGALADGWTVDNAAAYLWAITSPSVFRLLASQREWSPRRWSAETKRLLRQALLARP